MSHTRRFSIETVETPDVLPRVVGLCRRRGCEIIALDYLRGDRHRPGHLALSVRVPERQGRPLAAWLSSLVDVRTVREE